VRPDIPLPAPKRIGEKARCCLFAHAPMPCDLPPRFVRRSRAALCLLVLPGVIAMAAETKTINLPQFAYPEAMPPLLAAAGRAGVAVDTKEHPSVPRVMQAGDAMTFLVSLRDGDSLKQWILVAESSDLTAGEAQRPPLKGFHAFSSTGTEVNLGGRRAAIEMTLIGPSTQRQADQGEVTPEVKRRRLLVNADYLGLGFDAACESVLALRAAIAARPGDAAKFQPKMAAKPFSRRSGEGQRGAGAAGRFHPGA